MSPPVRTAILDYGAGNLRSAQRALVRAGADVVVTDDAATADAAEALVVPGVGHFGQCVRQFRAAGLSELVQDWAGAGRPVLAVCVGLQILYEASDEDPTPGLGVLPGRVRRLPADVTVPHMGWNSVQVVRPDPVLDGLDDQQAYFVHSYFAAGASEAGAAKPSDAGHVLAVTEYGVRFASVVRVGTVVGTQFHPEKSADVGARLLANFVNSVRQAVPA